MDLDQLILWVIDCEVSKVVLQKVKQNWACNSMDAVLDIRSALELKFGFSHCNRLASLSTPFLLRIEQNDSSTL
jgi:hypothetical protein